MVNRFFSSGSCCEEARAYGRPQLCVIYSLYFSVLLNEHHRQARRTAARTPDRVAAYVLFESVTWFEPICDGARARRYIIRVSQFISEDRLYLWRLYRRPAARRCRFGCRRQHLVVHCCAKVFEPAPVPVFERRLGKLTNSCSSAEIRHGLQLVTGCGGTLQCRATGITAAVGYQ